MGSKHAVCLCVDRNMLVPAAFVASAIKAASGNRSFDVLLFTGANVVDSIYRSWIEANGVVLCDDVDLSPLENIGAAKGRLTSATMMRLLLPGYLADRYEKILYLDSDLTIHGDLNPIFTLDTGPFVLAAAPSARVWAGWAARRQATDKAQFRALGMTEPFRFFNSGVLLIDVEKWNRHDVGERTLSFIRSNPALCFLPDEHGLNAVLDGRIAELSPLWNMRIGAWTHPRTRKIVDPVIIHYDGPEKPWRRFSKNRRLFQYEAAYRSYENFILGSPWPQWLRENWQGTDLRGNLAFEFKYWTGWMTGAESPVEKMRQRRAYAVAYERYCATQPFADVEQGIAVRVDGRLQVARRGEQ